MQKLRVLPFLVSILWLCTACSSGNTDLNGEELAKIHCGSCHSFVGPDLLPKGIWEDHVLPIMGEMMGIDNPEIDPLKDLSLEDRFRIKKTGYFPEQPRLSQQDWEKICTYFLEHAPEKLPEQKSAITVLPDLSLFKPKSVSFTKQGGATITYLEFDTLRKRIWASDTRGRIIALTPQGEMIRQWRAPSPVVGGVELPSHQREWLSVGLLLPNDRRNGILWSVDSAQNFTRHIKDLPRPVYMELGDLNRDGKMDRLVASFGNYAGKLAWYEGQDDGTFEEHELWPLAGISQTQLRDIDGDGDLDILALSGQGEEGLHVFINLGEKTFKHKQVLRFPAVFGSSSFEVADMDKDGDLDLIYTNGDNADYSYCNKPYHGVRIFINNGSWEFTEAFFAPVYGASKVMTRDFDGDGDLDLALISFFPDFETQANRGFLFFENMGNKHTWEFTVHTLPESTQGRWLVMDTADLDSDGDEDLLLGSFLFSATPVPDTIMLTWKTSPVDILILENQTY